MVSWWLVPRDREKHGYVLYVSTGYATAWIFRNNFYMSAQSHSEEQTPFVMRVLVRSLTQQEDSCQECDANHLSHIMWYFILHKYFRRTIAEALISNINERKECSWLGSTIFQQDEIHTNNIIHKQSLYHKDFTLHTLAYTFVHSCNNMFHILPDIPFCSRWLYSVMRFCKERWHHWKARCLPVALRLRRSIPAFWIPSPSPWGNFMASLT